MLLRPRQKLFVRRALGALEKQGNTLGVAPTGAGKTIMLSSVVGQRLQRNNGQACILAHRDELTAQNQAQFQRVNPNITTSVYDACDKSWDGQTIFAMVQTLSRKEHLKQIPPLDLLVVDEAHHVAAPTYQRIIEHAKKKNPNVAILGVTATPNRGDKKGLRPIFDNVCDQIHLSELIGSGHLVPPKTFVIDVGTQKQLTEVKRSADDFDMRQVDAIMNKAPITCDVIKHWRDRAGDRKTVVFCSTVHHARSVKKAFVAAGIAADLIHGELNVHDRKAVLSKFKSDQIQVLVNVAVLTEGWDYPPVSCIILLRPSSHLSTLIQMVGCGLRTLDLNEYPNLTKTDCIVLDFGISTLIHGAIEQTVMLDGGQTTTELSEKICPACQAKVPRSSRECALCGYVWQGVPPDDKAALGDFAMAEFDLLKRSAFPWCDLFDDDRALVATGFDAWSGIFYLNDHWYGVGGTKGHSAQLLAKGERTVCLAAADDWLNTHESDHSAHKSHIWFDQPATIQQLRYLPTHHRRNFGLTRYRASCLLAFQFNQHAIKSQVFKAAEKMAA